MVERRMRETIINLGGSFWYTAWINAGKPDLTSWNGHLIPMMNSVTWKPWIKPTVLAEV